MVHQEEDCSKMRAGSRRKWSSRMKRGSKKRRSSRRNDCFGRKVVLSGWTSMKTGKLVIGDEMF